MWQTVELTGNWFLYVYVLHNIKTLYMRLRKSQRPGSKTRKNTRPHFQWFISSRLSNDTAKYGLVQDSNKNSAGDF
ncbi:hypothetical protein DPEC_G00057820 [Dallia pectoralis]|uniref:Uncharacterized protein n=1 Tax=Dallia pectoralis TaxID=75939 RepID=A0ACC2H669_DALPE|nr:hypothetical protein DPEC_G00057820 [Dallia pectoralis]